MAYNPSSNYQLVQTGVWPDRQTSLKNSMQGISDIKQCFAVCDSDATCDGFVYSSSQARCETYAGTNFSSVHSWVPDGQLYRKSQQQPLGSGRYTGAPTKIGGCCGSIPTSTWALMQGARQPQVPNTNGRGSCGGFNGYGNNRGWNNGFGPGMPGNGCPESFDISMCPVNLGTPKGGSYGTSTGIPGSSDTGDLYSICQYDNLNWSSLLSAGTFDDSKGRQLLTEASWQQAKNDYCANWTNIDKTECIQWLQPSSTGSHSYNTVKMGLCTPPNVADWTADTRCVNAINQVFKTGSDSEKNMANQMVNLACGTNPNSTACACYNAANRSTDECLASPNLPGCKSIADKVGKYKSLGATFLTTALKPFCACDECTKAKTGSAGQYISQPAADQPGLCVDKINACFQQTTIGEMSGGTLNAGCTIQDINAAPGSPSGSPPGASLAPGAPPAPPGAPVTKGSDGSTLLITNPAVANVLDTNTKQYGAIGGCIFIILICLVLIVLSMGGDSSSSSPSASNIAFARLAGAGN